jgi:glycogen synthase
VRVALLSRAAHPLHEPGGLERAVYDLARHLQARGVETVLLTRPPTREGCFPGAVLTVPYATWPAGPHGRVLDRTLNYPGFAERVGRLVSEKVRAGEVDLVHAQGLTALGYGRARARDPALRAPLVMNPQGMEEHKATGMKGLALRSLRSLSREAARLSDRVIATDEATRHEVRALLSVPDERVVVLPNGIDLPALRAATPDDPRRLLEGALPRGIAAATLLLLSVGRIEAYKGMMDTLAALKILAASGELPSGWSWVVAGEGPLGAALDREASAFSGHIHRAGHVTDTLLHALYACADLLVHPTRYEGSSLVTLEAMAHRLPVVATRAGGIPDKVIDGQTGWLVPPGDTEALAAALREAAAQPQERRRRGRAGEERLAERFLWPGIAERTVALYELLLAEGRK